MKELTVYELMGEDYIIYAKLISQNQVSVKIENEDGEVVFKEKTHKYAWESLVYFAKQVLACNERIEQSKEVGE